MMNFIKTILFVLILIVSLVESNDKLPMIITTWKFTSAAEKAWETIFKNNLTTLDAIEHGCRVCELEQCDGTVGFGGSPDETGETTLDALLMDGTTMNVGAVAAVRRIKNVISVARKVLEHTSHSMLAGDLATKFAVEMGFKEESLSTPSSLEMWSKWTEKKCQPNFWLNVQPDPKFSCGPYSPINSKIIKKSQSRKKYKIGDGNHDTISMIAIDDLGNVSAGTSTNGAKHKIPGRVGDSPIPGAGAYADSSVGGAAATGDGDVMLRFLPSFLAVEEMRKGAKPHEAAATAVHRIAMAYPSFSGAVIAVNKLGDYGAACHGMESFPFVVANPIFGNIQIENVICAEPYINIV